MKNVGILSFLKFFAGLHFFLFGFISAPYLAQFISDAQVGYTFSLAAGITLVGFLFAPLFLRRIPLKTLTTSFTFLQITALTILAFNPPAQLAIPLIIVITVLPAFIAYALDIFLERRTLKENSTGNIRGIFITSGNIALILAPLIIGFILADTNAYWKVFVASSFSLVPFLLILFFIVRDGHTVSKQSLSIFKSMRCFFHSKNVALGSTVHFVLQLFFSWVTIYIPLYLHSTLGISWGSLGWVFALMLLPYLFLELPLGIVADRYIGEKEIMVLGLIIIAVSFASIGFFHSSSITVLLIAVLVATRIGGAMVEITTESYFFKHVSGTDLNSISLFRMLAPLGTIIGPLMGSALLFYYPIQNLFSILGATILLGIPFALLLKDTR